MSLLIFLPWRRKWHPTPVLLPGKSHGWRSLVGYSPWGRKESDMTEHFLFTFFFLMSSSPDDSTSSLFFCGIGVSQFSLLRTSEWVLDAVSLWSPSVLLCLLPRYPSPTLKAQSKSDPRYFAPGPVPLSFWLLPFYFCSPSLPLFKMSCWINCMFLSRAWGSFAVWLQFTTSALIPTRQPQECHLPAQVLGINPGCMTLSSESLYSPFPPIQMAFSYLYLPKATYQGPGQILPWFP